MELAHRLVSTRRGTATLAVLAALLAGVLIFAYVRQYRDSVRSVSAPVTVLVARTAIPKGTPGYLIASKLLFTATTIRADQLREGAFSDPASLLGRAASHDIISGQQLTATDFAAKATSIASTLTDRQRVVSVPLDTEHGLTDQLSAGDRVDVFAGFNITPVAPNGIPLYGGQTRAALRLVMQDIPVVAVGNGRSNAVGGGGDSHVTLKVNDRQAAQLAFAADNGKIWLALRPSTGAQPSRPDIVTAETLLLGVPPISVVRAFGGKR